MEKNEYVFFSIYYDKEILRQAVLVLNNENIVFKVEDKSKHNHARAPLSEYFEADLMIQKSEFERAVKLLED